MLNIFFGNDSARQQMSRKTFTNKFWTETWYKRVEAAQAKKSIFFFLFLVCKKLKNVRDVSSKRSYFKNPLLRKWKHVLFTRKMLCDSELQHFDSFYLHDKSSPTLVQMFISLQR